MLREETPNFRYSQSVTKKLVKIKKLKNNSAAGPDGIQAET